jgi:hypothetical protein
VPTKYHPRCYRQQEKQEEQAEHWDRHPFPIHNWSPYEAMSDLLQKAQDS